MWTQLHHPRRLAGAAVAAYSGGVAAWAGERVAGVAGLDAHHAGARAEAGNHGAGGVRGGVLLQHEPGAARLEHLGQRAEARQAPGGQVGERGFSERHGEVVRANEVHPHAAQHHRSAAAVRKARAEPRGQRGGVAPQQMLAPQGAAARGHAVV